LQHFIKTIYDTQKVTDNILLVISYVHLEEKDIHDEERKNKPHVPTKSDKIISTLNFSLPLVFIFSLKSIQRVTNMISLIIF